MSEQPTDTWIFLFSLIGIKLVSSTPLTYIFGDATLLSGNEVTQMSQGTFAFASDEKFADCYLAVKRGVLRGDKNSFDEAQEQASERAALIGAMMGLWVFTRTAGGFTCGLADSIRFKQSRIVAIPETPLPGGAGLSKLQSSNTTPVMAISFRQYTRESFVQDISQNGFKSVFENVGLRQGIKPIRDVVSRATERLAQGLYSQEHSEFLVATITALEILLSESGDNREKIIQRRYLTLVTGAKEANLLKIYTERNNWIHRGTAVSKPDAFTALSLGISGVISLSNFAGSMPDTSLLRDLFNFLDVVSITNSMSDDAYTFCQRQMTIERANFKQANR